MKKILLSMLLTTFISFPVFSQEAPEMDDGSTLGRVPTVLLCDIDIKTRLQKMAKEKFVLVAKFILGDGLPGYIYAKHDGQVNISIIREVKIEDQNGQEKQQQVICSIVNGKDLKVAAEEIMKEKQKGGI